MTPPHAARIIVVDDERIVAREIAEHLHELGYEVPGTAATADEALDLAERSRPDLALLDVRIRGPRDGVATAAVLRDRLGVPVVYLTACSDAESLRRAKETAPYAYLVKPVKPVDLRSAVELALQRGQIDRELSKERNWLSVTLDSISDAVVSVDAAGAITLLNRAAQALSGWSLEQALGRNFDEVLVLVDERSRARIPHPLYGALRDRARHSIPGGVLLRTANGGETATEGSATPLADSSGKLTGAVLVLHDVSEERRLRRQAELNDRLASLGTLAAGVAHEINNPLTFMIGNQQFARRKLAALTELLDDLDPNRKQLAGELVAEIGAALADAVVGSERVRSIVSELKKLGRPLTSQQHNLDLRTALDAALTITGAELGTRARVIREFGACPRVRADEVRLTQVFVNLLLNASQAIAPGQVDGNEIRIVASTGPHGGAVVEIRDTGAGIPKQIMARIFEPFFTTRGLETGSGLGLSISHGIVVSFGGSIEVESRVGVGSTFRVTLPATRQMSSLPPPYAPTLEPATPDLRARLLFVDDERILLDALARALEGHYLVERATSAQAALELLSAGNEYDLLICDLMMPGMTGMDLFRALEDCFPQAAARTAFMTGGAFTSAAQEFLGARGRKVLEKPFTNDELFAFLEACLTFGQAHSIAH